MLAPSLRSFLQCDNAGQKTAGHHTESMRPVLAAEDQAAEGRAETLLQSSLPSVAVRTGQEVKNSSPKAGEPRRAGTRRGEGTWKKGVAWADRALSLQLEPENSLVVPHRVAKTAATSPPPISQNLRHGRDPSLRVNCSRLWLLPGAQLKHCAESCLSPCREKWAVSSVQLC